MKRCLTILVIIVLILVGVGLVYMYYGGYDVAATTPHWALTRWVLSTTMDYSVRRYASGIEVPQLNDSLMIEKGLEEYEHMCAGCHGAPGVPQGEIAKGLNPPPPLLTEAVSDWSPAQLFWITKHGIKMSGMPAWGPTHSDEGLWTIVAFMKQLPLLSPEAYQLMKKNNGMLEHDRMSHEQSILFHQ